MLKKMRDLGMKEGDITLKELPPPEHPSALASKAIDAYIIGEPHAAKAEMEGYGRVLYQCGDLWPNFISCGLVVRQEVIDKNRPMVEELVRGIALSGKWLDNDLDKGAQHRKDAAAVASTKMFYNQKRELLEFVLTKDTKRVKYTDLKPPRTDSTDDGSLRRLQLDPEADAVRGVRRHELRAGPRDAPVPFDRLPSIDEVAGKQ
jgi:NitT/TauT family transport system substrate-binding protein